MAWLLKSEGALVRWLRVGGGCGIFVCLYIIGIFFYGALYFPSSSFDAANYFGLWGAFLTTLTQAFLAGCLAGMVNLFLLCAVSCSKTLRLVVKNISIILADIPVLGSIVVVSLVLPAFWAIVAIASFSLSARTLNAILSLEKTIPSSYQKTARSLRMGIWHSFWHIHVPLSLPKCSHVVLEDMPDFWVRLLGAQALVTLMHPHVVIGCGAQAVNFLRHHMLKEFSLTLFFMAAISLLAYQSFIKPLIRYAQRYDIPAFYNNEDGDLWERDTFFTFLLSIFLLLSTITFYYSSYNFIIGYKSVIFIALCYLVSSISNILWIFIGSNLSIINKNNNKIILYRMLPLIIAPCIFYAFFINSYVFFVLLITALIQFSFGQEFFSHMGGKQQKNFYKTARHLRLSSYSLMWNIKVPLILPILPYSSGAVLSCLWNSVFLASVLSPLSFMPVGHGLHGWDTETSIVFLSMMSFASLATRHGIIRPLQRFLVRKYKVFS